MQTTTSAQAATESITPDRSVGTSVEKPKEETPLFIEVPDGNGHKHKVCNMEHPDICPRKGHIVVEALRKSKRHETTVSFTNVRDRNTGIIYGIVQGIDTRTKELLFQRINLVDYNEYDLVNMQDAQIWAVVSRYSALEGSPLQYGKPMFKVKNREADAEKIIAKSLERDRASQIVRSLKGLQLGDMCRNLGIPPEHSSYNLMLSQLLETANNDPKKFLEVYDNTNRSILTVINRCKAVGLISYTVMKGHMWRDSLPLGNNEAMMVDYLTKNLQLLATMDVESKGLDNFYKEHAKDETVEDGKVILAESDKKSLLDKELEDVAKLKAELTEMRNKAKEREEQRLQAKAQKA